MDYISNVLQTAAVLCGAAKHMPKNDAKLGRRFLIGWAALTTLDYARHSQKR